MLPLLGIYLNQISVSKQSEKTCVHVRAMHLHKKPSNIETTLIVDPVVYLLAHVLLHKFNQPIGSSDTTSPWIVALDGNS